MCSGNTREMNKLVNINIAIATTPVGYVQMGIVLKDGSNLFNFLVLHRVTQSLKSKTKNKMCCKIQIATEKYLILRI